MPQKMLIFLLLITSTFALAQKQEPRLVLPVGHTRPGLLAVFDFSNRFVLTASWDHTARLWDVKTGKELLLLKGHEGDITSISFSHDNKLILTGSADKTIRVWDIETGKIIKVIKVNGQVKSAKFSCNDNNIVTSTRFSGENSFQLWDVKTGNEIQVFKGHCGRINNISFGSDQKNILTASDDSTARIWDVSSGIELIKLKGHSGGVSSAFLSPSSKLALTASSDNTARIWEVNSGKELQVLSGHTDGVTSAVFSADGKLALTASWDNTARIYEVATGNELHVLRGHNRGVYSAVFSPDNKLALTASFDSTARIYEIATGKELNVFFGLQWDEDVAFSPDGKLVLTSNIDTTIRIYNVQSGKEVQRLQGYTETVRSTIFRSKNNLVISALDNNAVIWDKFSGKELMRLNCKRLKYADFNNDCSRIITEGWNDTIRTWETQSGKELFLLRGRTSLDEGMDYISSFGMKNTIFSSDGKLLLSILDKNICISDEKSGRIHRILSGHTDYVNSALFSSDNQKLLSFDDSTVRIWSVESGKELTSLKGHSSTITCANFNSENTLILTSSFDRTARIWDVFTGKELLKLQGHDSPVYFAIFSPDNKMVLTGSQDGILKLWDSETGNEIKMIIAHKSYVSSASFLANGKQLLMFSERDQTICLWDLEIGKEIWTLNGHVGFIKSIFFSEISKNIITTGEDHKTILWDISTGKPIYTRLQLEGDNWLVYDTNYRFDGSPGAIEKLYFVCGLEVVELNQVKDSLYVPNLVQRIMNGENLDRLPKLSDLNICGVTPIVEPIEKSDGGYHYEITPRTGGVGDIEIYLNGVVRQTENAKRLKLKNGKYSIQVDPKLIDRYQVPGEALQVKVIAKTANNSISSRGIVLDLESDEPTSFRKPSLHAVMIGVDDYKDDNLDLNYAAKDANDLHQALEQASKKFFNVDDTNRVFFYNLTRNREGKLGTDKIKGKTPDKANINQTLEEIEKKSKPEDILLVFFAGHGEIVDKDQLLLLTTEATSANFEGIRMRELLEQLNKIPAGKRVLILDACHSGAAINNIDMAQLTGKRDVKDAERQSQRLKELDKLASKSGFAIITASSSDQKALELPQYEHGLMTYALLNAMLNNKSSLDENNQLQLEKWLIATEEEVKKLNQNQSAERMVPVTFTLGKIDDEVRSSIVLKEIPTVYVSNVLNIDLGFDDQKIKGQLINYFSEKSRGTEKTLFVSEIEQPNSVQVNVVYTISTNQITFKATLLKNNEVVKRIEKSGNLTAQSSLLNELMVLIEKEVK